MICSPVGLYTLKWAVVSHIISSGGNCIILSVFHGKDLYFVRMQTDIIHNFLFHVGVLYISRSVGETEAATEG